MVESAYTEEFRGGAALSFALISVDSMSRSVEFYRDLVGLTVIEAAVGSFTVAAEDSIARPGQAVMLREPGTAAGGVLLVEFAERGSTIRKIGDRTTRGFWNVNFYVRDIDAATNEWRARGYQSWTMPTTYEVGPQAGAAREVLIEGPDGVAVNLVQPMGGPETFTGRIRAEVERHGMTRSGCTPVCTTAHCLHDMSAAVPFYRDVLGMRVVLDEVLGKPETNHFLSRPVDARAHTVFVAGDHFFGKIALNQPLNYPVAERSSQAHAPNIGYLAQGFAVENLADVAARLDRMGTGYQWRAVPVMREFGGARLLQLRVPGSGGFALIYERG